MAQRKRNVDLEAEMGADIDLTEEEANDARTLVETPIAKVVETPAPSHLTMSVSDIQAIVKTAVEAAQSGNAAIADIVTQGIAQARKPIPEGTDQSNPRISVFNPLGDRDHPRPLLKCEMFLGTQDGEGKPIQRTYPFNQDDLTVHEILALNILEPGQHEIALYDGMTVSLKIVPEYDQATKALRRLVLVVPSTVTGKGSALKNMLPGPTQIVGQITGVHFGQKPLDELAWFMAEHRKKNYVSKREAVAA